MKKHLALAVIFFCLFFSGCLEENKDVKKNSLSAEEKRFVGFWNGFKTKIEYTGPGSDNISDNPYYDNSSFLNLTFYSDGSWDQEVGPIGSWQVKNNSLLLESKTGFWKSIFSNEDERIEFNYSFSYSDKNLELTYVTNASSVFSDENFSDKNVGLDSLKIIWVINFSQNEI